MNEQRYLINGRIFAAHDLRLQEALARIYGTPARPRCLCVGEGVEMYRSPDELTRKALQTPLGRVVTAEDVALAVLSCATHLRTATGTTLVINGGHRL